MKEFTFKYECFTLSSHLQGTCRAQLSYVPAALDLPNVAEFPIESHSLIQDGQHIEIICLNHHIFWVRINFGFSSNKYSTSYITPGYPADKWLSGLNCFCSCNHPDSAREEKLSYSHTFPSMQRLWRTLHSA